MKSVVILLFAGMLAQDPLQPTAPQTPVSNIVAVRPSDVALPEGNGVWVVLVRRSGGFAGVSSTVTVRSDGKLDCAGCTDPAISRILAATALQSATPSFSFGVAPVSPAPPNARYQMPLPSLCMDCFKTHLTIQRRDADGKIETYAAEWDVTTTGQWPAEFVTLANTILGLAK